MVVAALARELAGFVSAVGREMKVNWSARLEMCQWRRETLDKVKGLEIQYRREG